MEHNLSSLRMCTEMPLNHWFERHICGTNGAVAQLCQNSPQKSCCVVVHDYWTGHLYMHIQQHVWYPTRLSLAARFLKLPYAAWYATHTGSPSGHHQQRLKSDEEKERVKRGREKKKKSKRENSLHSVPEKAQHFQKSVPCFDHSVFIWWTVAQRLLLLGPPSYPFSHRLQSNFCPQTFWQLFDLYTTCFYKTSPQQAYKQWERVPRLPLSFLTSPHNSFGKWSKLICHSWARALITY